MKTSFELTLEALEQDNLIGVGAARACKANTTTILNYCADNSIDLLKPKPTDLPYLVELLLFLANEGLQCKDAFDSFSATKH